MQQPNRYLGIGEARVGPSSDEVDDSLSYCSAMDNLDKEWLKAMNLKVESMYSNSVWKLID